jgi:hypothetical protein
MSNITGLNIARKLDPYRCTGRSTAIAMETIGNAMAHPGSEICFEDHHGTRHADAHLASMINDILIKLNFCNFKIGQRVPGRFYLIYERL